LGVEKTPDREMVYPAKDWKEALQRITDSKWNVTIWGRHIPDTEDSLWTCTIHSESQRSSSIERYFDTALQSEGGIADAIMKAYNKWRDGQLKGDEEDED